MVGDVSELMIPDRRQLLLMDGTQQALDLVSKAALSLTGGVGGAWPGDESNWRQLLSRGGVYLPVIGSAVDNLLSDEDSSFEAGTVGSWGASGGGTLANAALGWHGAKSMSYVRSVGAGSKGVLLTVTSITAAGSQYTVTAQVKGDANAVGRIIRPMIYGDVSGSQYGSNVTLTTEWQRATVTATYNAGDTVRRIYFYTTTDGVDATYYIDAVQLESGGVASPYCLGSRDSCTMYAPTPVAAGAAWGLMLLFTTIWQGNDGVAHYMFYNLGTSATRNCFYLIKGSSSTLAFDVYDDASNLKRCNVTVNGTNWPEDTPHVIILNRFADGVMDAYFNGVQFTTLNSGAGTGLESIVAANTYYGTTALGASPFNGAMLAYWRNQPFLAGEITRYSSGAWPRRYRRQT